MIFDGFAHQVPDIDPTETDEWLDSFDSVIGTSGKARARFILMKLLSRAIALQVNFPATVSTPYVNTIPADEEPPFPGDEYLEQRIRAYVRWNAAVMVTRANARYSGIGGHLSTYAAAGALYEVGFNHFFHGKDDGPGDQVFFQGHASPGIYARAFVEGRLSESELENFRFEAGGHGLSSYPHPRLMPDFWEFPTVSMGLGPIGAVYQARFNRYLMNRGILDTSASRVWCFAGDGEFDEPESRAGLSLATRERLDNLIFVVNCNLQRLDGPVRGNGKIIQELEAEFRGNGWNVIKVIWGSRWDELLARDTDGVLVDKMNSTLDGDFQRMTTAPGAYIREHFFGPDPRLAALVAHLSDEELQTLPRGGHDYRKLYAAYKAATENTGAPTAILAKTIKGWKLGPEIEARNATHQIKKMTHDQLRALRDRLKLQVQVPDVLLDSDKPPYARPEKGSPEYDYLMARLREQGGPLPHRVVRGKGLEGLPAPVEATFSEFREGSGSQAVSTTMVFARLLRNLMRDENVGRFVVPIIPDEGRTFGLDALFAEMKIYSPRGQLYTSVDASLPMHYAEAVDGQILEEGITEAGGMASFMAAGTAYATWSQPMLPFYMYYSMFGFQRVGDQIWQLADERARGFLIGCTAGRTTMNGEGLQHEDGQSHVLATDASEPARLRPVVRLRGRGDREGRHPRDVRPRWRGRLLLPHRLQRELPDARPPGGRGGRAGRGGDAPGPVPLLGPGTRRGPPRPERRGEPAPTGDDPLLGDGLAGRRARPRTARQGLECVGRDVVGNELQVPARGRSRGRALEPPPPRRNAADPVRHAGARHGVRPDRRRHRLHEGRARPDRPLRQRAVHAARHGRFRTVRHPRDAPPALRG